MAIADGVTRVVTVSIVLHVSRMMCRIILKLNSPNGKRKENNMACYFAYDGRVTTITEEQMDQHQDHNCVDCQHGDTNAVEEGSPCFDCGPFADKNGVPGQCHWEPKP